MATVNIGNLTFTHKGDYAGGTTYAKNDVVYYATNGNAYIAKQATTGNAPTSTAHWDVFAAGSGGIWNAGLSLGSAGQAVKVNTAGNALEFGTISSDYVKIAAQTLDGTGVGSFEFQNCFSAANDALYGGYHLQFYHQTSSNHGLQVRFMSGTNTELTGSTDYRHFGSEGYRQTNNSNNSVSTASDGDGTNSMPWDGWGQNGANNSTEGAHYIAHFQGAMYGGTGQNRGCFVNASNRDSSSPNYGVGRSIAFRYEGTSNITGLKFFMASGEMINGQCTLWGLKK